MIECIRLLVAIHKDKRGVTAVEYGIMASLIAAGLVSAVGFLTGGFTNALTKVGSLMGT